MKSKQKKIIILFILGLFFISSLNFPILNFINSDLNPESSLPTFYKDKSYPFTLSDVYDDENSTKIYKQAFLQTEYEFNGTIYNNTVSVVNNTNYKSPSNTDVSMIHGTFDNSNNMKANDDFYSEFNSTKIQYYNATYDFDNETVGTSGLSIGFVSELFNDPPEIVSQAYPYGHTIWFEDVGASSTGCYNYFRSAQSTGTIEFWAKMQTTAKFFRFQIQNSTTASIVLTWDDDGYFKDSLGGMSWAYDTSYHHYRIILGASNYDVYVDLDLKGDDLSYPNSLTPDRLFVRTRGSASQDYEVWMDAVGYSWDPYYTVGDNLISYYPSLNFTVGLDFPEVLSEDLLAIDVYSYHFTNISQTITGKIYNFSSSSYVQMFSSDHTSETENIFVNTTSPGDFLDGSGNLQLYFTGTGSNPFNLSVDYIRIRFYYKMDLIIYKSFSLTGVWRYRFKLIGSLHYTDWTVFEVIDPPPNFYAISESDLTTRWILQNATLTPAEDFHDDINTDAWRLTDVSQIDMITSSIVDGDAFTFSNSKDNNYGTETYFYVLNGTKDPDEDWYIGFLKEEYSYLDLNYTSNSLLSYYLISNLYENISVFKTSNFVENTITWNNMPSRLELLAKNDMPTISGFYSLNLGSPNYYYRLEGNTTENVVCKIASKESINPAHRPTIIHYLSKNYFGSGYTYMQTNTTELIGLKSKDYTTHYNLSSGDYFEIDFQTSSDSQINLILLKNGVVNKTLTLSSSGNTNFNRHTVQIPASELLEFDQLKISSTFEDKDNIKVYDIKTYKYTITGDNADFYVGSKRDYEIYLTPSEYNLRIFEEGLKKADVNITIPSSGVYQYVYTPIQSQECRLTLFSVSDPYTPLIFENYHVKINQSLNGEYRSELYSLVEPIFYADINTTVYIYIYDRFNTLLYSDGVLVTDYIDIDINVHQLQLKNLMLQQTTIDINGSDPYLLLSGDSIYFMLSEADYLIGYYNPNNIYTQFLIHLVSNQAYELNMSRICNLYYTNQRGEYLEFHQFKTYVNGTLLLQNVFYATDGEHKGIEIKDRYGISIKNETYIEGTDPYNQISIILTQYSLKVMSQQLVFNHINITRDPNYYESSYYWSEWIAPGEIIKFTLFPGYYKINLTNNEAGSSSYYSYTLSGDDILLITSDNTIYNVLVNLANVNATIGNQITNVQIDLTNQNSQINNSIINVDINLGNINSTLGNMLINLDVDIDNVANNISALYMFTNTSFINIGNNINNSFISMENNIISINQSISTLVIGVSNDIYLINGTISTMITQMENNLLLMNVSINTALFDIDTAISQISSNISNNFILLNNSIYMNNLNINDSRVAIINNLALINNTISTLISQVYSSVYMINNSIYTAIVDVGTYLSLMNNTIAGNLTIVLEQNKFLTSLYQTTMFSELLNWTDIGLNASLIESQIDVWTFINHYINQSIVVHLKYQDLIEELVITAGNPIEQWLPKYNVSYNLWSVDEEKYLDDWKELDINNKTVNFGFYEEDFPDLPDWNIGNTWLMIVLIVASFSIIIIFLVYVCVRYYKRVEGYRKSHARKLKIESDTIDHFTSGHKIK